jgi:tRNA threonylcarbamoyladenosine biosynthesis protein TsaE
MRKLNKEAMEIVVELPSVAATEQLGQLLAEHLPPGTVVALSGTLGAGKTRLVQAVAAGCGVDPAEVTSPTFVLCREYYGNRVIYHLDAYRLKDEDEFLELGPEEMFASDGLVFIEWAERVESFLPEERMEIVLEVTGETSRRVTLRATGESLAASIQQISQRLAEKD